MTAERGPYAAAVCAEHDRPAIYCRQHPSAKCEASGRETGRGLTPQERADIDAADDDD